MCPEEAGRELSYARRPDVVTCGTIADVPDLHEPESDIGRRAVARSSQRGYLHSRHISLSSAAAATYHERTSLASFVGLSAAKFLQQ